MVGPLSRCLDDGGRSLQVGGGGDNTNLDKAAQQNKATAQNICVAPFTFFCFYSL